jgi:hypothetical protein
MYNFEYIVKSKYQRYENDLFFQTFSDINSINFFGVYGERKG